MQYINNVVYNWGSSGYDGGHSGAVWNQDLINNYFIKGPSSNNSFLAQFSSTDHVYQTGNLVDLDVNGVLGGRAVVEADFLPNSSGSPSATFLASASNFPSASVTVHSASDAYQLVLAGAGDSLHRDSVDTRIVNQVLSLGALGAIITDERNVGGAGTVVGGVAPVDTDRDGMPDAWELANGLNPSLASDGSAMAGSSGYTNVEVYLNSLVAVPEPATIISMLSAAVLLLPQMRRSLLRGNKHCESLFGQLL